MVEDVQAEFKAAGLRAAVRRHDTAAIFDWLIEAVSYQGIADRVAHDYIRRHGTITWADIEANLAAGITCPKLTTYWQFQGCRYHKTGRTCAEPDHIDGCCLPRHPLRNGRLNQTAYSLFLFIRDVCDGDLVGWIDRQLEAASASDGPDRVGQMREALLTPLRQIYGVSDKVLTMALSCLLVGGSKGRPLWGEIGVSLIAVDTLVHNFLHRTGILRRLDADHAYGPACYQSGGCADIIAGVAERIDARAFNLSFPQVFPRYVQAAIWRYCAQLGFDICNGNNIDDRQRCQNSQCTLYSICDRISLKS